MKKTLKMIGWNFLLLMLLLLITEGIVRIFDLAPQLKSKPSIFGGYISDPHLPFKPEPNSVRVEKTDEFEMDVIHNSLGFRDIEHTIEKPDSVYRILGLGDSYTYGVGVQVENTYLYKLEEMLQMKDSSSKEIEIIKAGIARYFPEPERLLLEHYGLQFNPDLVMVGFLPNDIVDTYFGLESVTLSNEGYLLTREGAALGDLGTWLFFNSHFGRIVLSKYVALRIRMKYTVRDKDLFIKDGYHEKDWKKIEEEYSKMRKLTKTIGAKMAVIYIPGKGPYRDHHNYAVKRISDWCEANDALFINTLPAMKQYDGAEKLYFEKDVHYTEVGYELVAETIYNTLIINGFNFK
ncbi:MAG: hypothetical protein IIA45_00835 [Bacteroidetes bacterium]|nr:hypothetical protein [Bacteroidota bacterium]